MKREDKIRKRIDSINGSAYGLSNQILDLQKDEGVDVRVEIIEYLKEKLGVK